MKQILSTLMLATICSFSMTAKTIQPVIFDDPTFDINSASLSPEQRSFFERYASAMEQIENGADAEQFFIIEHATEDKEVAPLLGGINYNQGYPYNNMCPYLNGGRAVTGCVATAMAQVMRYYKYPQKGTGTFTYTGGNDGAKTMVLDNYPFDWDNMLETYDNVSFTQEQADAVATLMLACGASLNMNYSKDGSGSDLSKMDKLLKNNFGYSKDIRFISTLNSSNPDETIFYWGEDAVRPELEAGHPLIFAGFPAIGKTGHCFVVDGYKVENGDYYYHVNWGWGGAGNCYCLLTKLQEPGGDNYSGYNLQMLYRILPPGWLDVEEVNTKTTNAQKVLKDGQLIIQINDAQYTIQGQKIK